MEVREKVLDVLQKHGISVAFEQNDVITTEGVYFDDTIACARELIYSGIVPENQVFRLNPRSGNMCRFALEIHLS